MSFRHVLRCILTLSLSIALLPKFGFCQSEEFAGETVPEDSMCETPDVLLLLDRSGSMLDDQKWEQATAAVSEVFTDYFGTLRFGMMTFPTSGSCGVAEGELAITVGEAQSANLQEIYDRSTPTDGALTPLSEAIRIGHLELESVQVPQRRGYLILLTDGIETCAPEALEDTAPVAATREAANAGFNTYVIGFGSLVRRSTLREMARVGGTEQERVVNDQSQLVSTLSEIVNSATTERCDRLDNDCDGYIDEGIDCEAQCDSNLNECPCNNNLDCATGESCEENICVPAPCSVLCDAGLICFEDTCVPENSSTPGSSPSNTGEQSFTPSMTPPPSPGSSPPNQGDVTSGAEESCHSSQTTGPLSSPLFSLLTLISMITLLWRQRSARG